ncbi:MAG TPA: DUF2182 domain-containing protein [Ktedonobacterales bacterium]
MLSQYAAIPVRERNAILVALLGLSAAAWALMIWQNTTVMTSAPMGLTLGMGAALFLAIWIVMMVAMMFPSAAPMVLMFAAVSAGKRRQGQASTPTWVFVSGYLLIWVAFGGLAYLLALGGDQLAARSMWLMDNAPRIGGVALVAAGAYQLSPLKRVCLSACRTPIQFLLTSWRDGSRGALRMGVEHGLFCLGCCWWLMLILFPLGLMNVAALGSVAALIFVEKCLPIGRSASRVAAGALMLYGAVIIINPAALPTML